MASISTSIELYDRMTAPLMSIMNALNMTVSSMHDMQSAMGSGIDTSALEGATEAANQAQDALNAMEQEAREMSQSLTGIDSPIEAGAAAQNHLNGQMKEGANQSNALANNIKKIMFAYLSMQSIRKVIDISDDLISTTARIDQMNGAFNELNGTAIETDDMIQKIYASAQNARGSFGAMASVVARIGNNARDAFGSQDEVIEFANLVQKQMAIAGASAQESSNAMIQLSQALGSGVLRGDELNSIFEQAPNLIQSIADYMGVPIGKIKEMASEGQLTADIVKNAIFASAEDINSKFEEMPMTWAQVWTMFQNDALMAFRPVLSKINEFANNPKLQAFVKSAVQFLSVLSLHALSALEIIGSIAGFIYDNWSVISPIVWGVVAVFAAYNAVLAITKMIQMGQAVASAIQTGAQIALSVATFMATVQQHGFNAALMACPITWIVLAVVAFIAVIIALAQWIANVTGAAKTGFGIIVGVVAVAVAAIANRIIGLINVFIVNGINLWNYIVNFVSAFSVIFNDPIAGIKALFLSLFNFIVGIVTAAASLLDTIFGSNLAEAVAGFQSKIQAEIDATIESAGGTALRTENAEDFTLERIDYSDAFQAGTKLGDNIAGSITGLFGAGAGNPMDTALGSMGTYGGAEDFLAQTAGNTSDMAGNTGRMADSLEVSSENLKYLRDIAESEAVNRFTTAEIQVTMNNNNNITHTDDIDGMVDRLYDGVLEAMEIAAEGV